MNHPSPRWKAIATSLALLTFLFIHRPVAAQLGASPSSISFGSVAVGTKAALWGTLTNRDTANVTIKRVTVYGTSFTFGGLTLPVTLAPGKSTTFKVTFTPTSAGSVTGSFEFTATTPMYRKHWKGTLKAYVTLSGSGVLAVGQLAANPASLAFGTVPLGSKSSQYQTVTNKGTSSVSISQATVSSPEFSVSGLDLPQTLGSGQSLTFSVTFAPQASGSVSGNLTLTSNASNATLPIALSGSASAPGQLSVNPGIMSFGSVVVGQSATQTGTLSASGSSVTVSAANVSTSEFAVSGLKLPLTLNAGQSVSYSVTFIPQATGTASASLAFSSNATTPTVAETLTGTGMAAPSHSVDISWNPSSSSSVAGYNVYRGDQAAGPFTKLNSALDVTTAYTDATVLAGKTYYYVATAVDGGGTESPYSNAVSVTIPTP